MSTDVQEFAGRYGAAWAAHDLDAIMAMHTEETVFHLHGGAEPAVGWAATRDAFAEGTGTRSSATESMGSRSRADEWRGRTHTSTWRVSNGSSEN